MTVKLRRINSAALVASKIATGSSTSAAATEPQCSAVPQDRQTSNYTSQVNRVEVLTRAITATCRRSQTVSTVATNAATSATSKPTQTVRQAPPEEVAGRVADKKTNHGSRNRAPTPTTARTSLRRPRDRIVAGG